MACGGLFLNCSAAISFSLASTSARHLLARDGVGMAGGDLQGDVLHELLEFLFGRRCSPCPRRLRRARRPWRRCECRRRSGRCRLTSMRAWRGILMFSPILATAASRSGFEVHVGIGGEPLGDLIGEGAEHVVARDEIGLAVHFDEHAELAAGGDVLGDDAFAGFARRRSCRRWPCRPCAGCPPPGPCRPWLR